MTNSNERTFSGTGIRTCELPKAMFKAEPHSLIHPARDVIHMGDAGNGYVVNQRCWAKEGGDAKITRGPMVL